jgi:hypothetical protein
LAGEREHQLLGRALQALRKLPDRLTRELAAVGREQREALIRDALPSAQGAQLAIPTLTGVAPILQKLRFDPREGE